MSVLEQNITSKEQADKNVTWLEFEAGDSEKYEVEAIWDSAVYKKKSESGQLQGLYYLVLWKGYPKAENTWELSLAVQYFRRIIGFFHKNYPNKLTATFPAVDTTLPMVKPTARLTQSTQMAKQKRGCPAKTEANKRAKNRAR